MKIAIVDYGMGNIFSIQKKINQIGFNTIVTSDYKILKNADKIILPGVGHFGSAIYNLEKLGLKDALNEMVLIKKTPILGICLGMQLMATTSEEGDSFGFDWFDAAVVKFRVSQPYKFKVPQIGWNTININTLDNILMKNIPNQAEFYFVHSYHVVLNDMNNEISSTEYDYLFSSAINKDHIFGVQYHPEKSHVVGNTLFQNFLDYRNV